MQTQSTLFPSEIRHGGSLSRTQKQWISFNRKLSRDAVCLPNEAFIEERLEALMGMEIEDFRIFWLTFSRIAELALKLAGDYADNCEFQAAGDLLVNPRRIDVYRRGCTTQVVKDRHRGLSDLFATAIGKNDPVAWLSRETCPHIRKEALLPYLKQMLSLSGSMAPEYLSDMDRRLCRVADTIAFLMSWQVEDGNQLFRRMQEAGPEGRAFVLSNLCRFDSWRFNAMVTDIEKLVFTGWCQTRFLREPDAK